MFGFGFKFKFGFRFGFGFSRTIPSVTLATSCTTVDHVGKLDNVSLIFTQDELYCDMIGPLTH